MTHTLTYIGCGTDFSILPLFPSIKLFIYIDSLPNSAYGLYCYNDKSTYNHRYLNIFAKTMPKQFTKISFKNEYPGVYYNHITEQTLVHAYGFPYPLLQNHTPQPPPNHTPQPAPNHTPQPAPNHTTQPAPTHTPQPAPNHGPMSISAHLSSSLLSSKIITSDDITKINKLVANTTHLLVKGYHPHVSIFTHIHTKKIVFIADSNTWYPSHKSKLDSEDEHKVPTHLLFNTNNIRNRISDIIYIDDKCKMHTYTNYDEFLLHML